MSTIAANAYTTDEFESRFGDVIRKSRLQALWPVGLLAATFLYLIYAWFAFDMTTLIGQSRLDRAAILALDSFAHKVHVTRSLRQEDEPVTVALEGLRDGVYDQPPAWVQPDGSATRVDMGDGYFVTILKRGAVLSAPGFEPIRIQVNPDDSIEVTGPTPEWVRTNPRRFEARPTLFKRIQVTRTKIEVHRYFLGWENFFFSYGSDFQGMSAGQVFTAITGDRRFDETMPNWQLAVNDFLTNREWQHGDVFTALLETVLMALLGTAVASIVGLPLAFLAASNFNPVTWTRMALRRVFDFLRGIDMLIWSLIFIRAFGLGPLTGIMAIAFTDTGTLGKLFSEAIENIDNKQVDGVKSTGAAPSQRYRFGVIPQILPIFVAQSLYYLESNTRSATVIGALGAGGIGLKLVETLRTGRDWENTLYIIVLTVLVVVMMDIFSGWLRRKLIRAD